MNTLPPAVSVTCERCGCDRAEHHLANMSDGALVSKYLLVCPTAVFKAKGHDIDGMPYTMAAGSACRCASKEQPGFDTGCSIHGERND